MLYPLMPAKAAHYVARGHVPQKDGLVRTHRNESGIVGGSGMINPFKTRAESKHVNAQGGRVLEPSGKCRRTHTAISAIS
jgi:hypothetical protein